MHNDVFSIKINANTGGIYSLIINGDAYKSNCIKPESDFSGIAYNGIFAEENFVLLDMREDNNECVCVSKSKNFEFKRKYRFTECGNLCVENEIINISNSLICFNAGELGINLSFRDEYPDSETCMHECYNEHIHCSGSGASYICALKMGESKNNVGLFITEGGFSSYSQRGVCSNNRGEFILHPDLHSLHPRETYRLFYEIFPCESKSDFLEKCKSYNNFIHISSANYSYFFGEDICFYIECNGAAEVFCNNEKVAVEKDGARYYVKYAPSKTGEHGFTVRCGNSETCAVFNVMLPLRELSARRVKFITEKQQCTNADSILDGAYLVYDCEDKRQYYSRDWPDMNAGRERIGMGLLLARYLRLYPDGDLMKSLMRYEAFVRREIYDESTGEIYDDADHCERVRLYNYLWYATFYTELFYLTKNKSYIKDVKKIIERYYEKGGARHYPNAVIFSDFITLMREHGTKADEKEIADLFRKHIDTIAKAGSGYPKHEVNYEQTIVSPAVTLLTDAMYVFDKNQYGTLVKPHLERLERFDGFAPHYKRNNVAIRFWDGFWFGKRHNFGDTFPHYWSCLSSVDYSLYGSIIGDSGYMQKGICGLRNCLCLFFEDGSASSASVFPFSVNGQRGNYFDPYANDQDFALYYALRFCAIEAGLNV